MSLSSGFLTREQAFALVEAVGEHEGLALAASAHEVEETSEWLFEATCQGEPDIDAFSELARQVLGGDVSFTAEPIDPEVNWVAKSLEGLQPVVAGGFYIHGSHSPAAPPPGLTPILIEAAQAFGTGHHETTTGCLEALEQLLEGRKPQVVIDVGTGTGVLAIALAKRLEVPVLATDIDPVAVKTTRENARLNGVEKYVVPVEAAGLSHWMIAANAPYDLIVANILAGPLVTLAPAVNKVAVEGAAIVLSGLLASQIPDVAAAYEREGMGLRSRIIREGWATLTLEKV